MPERLTPSQQRELRAERPCSECGGPMVIRDAWQGEGRFVCWYLACQNKDCGHTEPVR